MWALPQLAQHCVEQHPGVEELHKPKLVRQIAERYFKVMLLTHIKR